MAGKANRRVCAEIRGQREDKLGSIETGKLADLIVIDRDYMTIPEDEIHEINVLLTMVGGKVVYEVGGGLQ